MPLNRVAIRVFAKINLFLRIIRRRDDGYHEIETVMHPVGLADELVVEKSAEGLTFHCDHPDSPKGLQNTVVRMYNLLKERFPKKIGSCRIRLKKSIPAKAGMGGASADAAGTLLALNRLFDLDLDHDEQLRLGSSIGSDVPFFLGNGPALCTGRGEKLRVLKGHLDSPVALAISAEGVSTSEAYGRFQPDPAEGDLSAAGMEAALSGHNLQQASHHLYNTFERLVYPVRPDLQHIQRTLLASGASGAMMTGSGATVFALGMDCAGLERAREVLDPMGRQTVLTVLQPNTYEWLSERGADPGSDPS